LVELCQMGVLKHVSYTLLQCFADEGLTSTASLRKTRSILKYYILVS
jgi:hypothetical protein